MIKYWLWLSQRKGIRPRHAMGLLRLFATPQEIYAADELSLTGLGLTQPQLQALLDKDMSGTAQVLEQCAQKDIQLISFQDEQYPSALRAIFDPPLVLYVKGTLPDFSARPTIALVGARKGSAYGLAMAMRLGYQLARGGAILVCGMAAGIDAAGATGALTADGSVVGVLGSGVDVVYPRENRRLYQDVLVKGCLISEYPPGTPPLAGNFPVRNRILSGLCNGVLVAEAGAKSGALITANLALEQGRDVFAVPGNIGVAACEGSNRLLKEGAALVEDGWDILREYAHLYPLPPQEGRDEKDTSVSLEGRRLMVASAAIKPQPSRAHITVCPETPKAEAAPDPSLPPEQQAILTALGDKELHVDEIIAGSGLPAAQVLGAITLLEMSGQITRLPGKRFVRG